VAGAKVGLENYDSNRRRPNGRQLRYSRSLRLFVMNAFSTDGFTATVAATNSLIGQFAAR
jgi:hypothetical protein